MSSFEETIARVARDLERFSLSVSHEFLNTAHLVRPRLTPQQFEMWSDEGTAIARHSYRSWEAATEFFRVSPRVLEVFVFGDMLRWSNAGKELARHSTQLSTAYFKASPEVVFLLPPEKFPVWAEQGRRLYKETWKSSALCCQFYEASANLLAYLSVDEMDRLIHFVDSLAINAHDVAVECLALGASVLGQIDRQERVQFLSLAALIGRQNWKAARSYFEAGPRVLSAVGKVDRKEFLALAERFAKLSRERAVAFFLESAEPLRLIDREAQGAVITLAREILPISAEAAADFLKIAPQILRRVDIAALKEWAHEGILTLRASQEAGTSYFRLESNRAQRTLEQLSAGLELYQVSEVLRMYCKALAGRNVGITNTKELTDKSLGWTAVEKATTEGTTIYLPPYVETFSSKEDNFNAYKVLATHQTGHLEFGSFEFEFDRPAAIFQNLRPKLLEASPRRQRAITEFETLFDLFPNRRLAKHIFMIAEDARIDFRVKHEYKGIARSYRKMQAQAMETRPDPKSLPFRQSFLERMIQLGLGQTEIFSLPAAFVRHFQAMAGILSQLCVPNSTVEDAAEATVRLFAIVAAVPNVSPEALLGPGWVEIDLNNLDNAEAMSQLDLAILEALTGGKDPFGVDLPGSPEELPYEGPQDVEHWGDFKPELVQALMKVRKDAVLNDDLPAAPLTPEELKALLEKSDELEITELGEDDIAQTSGLFVTNLLKEGLKAKAKKKKKERKDGEQRDPTIVEGDPPPTTELDTYTYDEWDFRANDYKPDWCVVAQMPMEEGSVDFFDATLKSQAALVTDIKRQFELLRPELFRKLKRLKDGDEFELDSVIEAIVERKAGITPTDKLYSRRNKVERSVSVVFLLDMSASTDEEIKPPDDLPPLDPPPPVGGYNPGSNWQQWEVELPRGKRIIDLEKEGLVLLIKALETIGDRYGIYGFSGYGRENVEFYVLKDLDEDFGDRVKKRIDKVAPIRGTRMGPAIRHATAKLEEKESKIRLLVLLSDGRPQDHDYGKDRTEKEYGIHDTKMALVEARRKGIIPFCLTVDKSGHDYLGAMCGDIGYEVLSDIESLPRRLPTLYRKLTS